jgi:N-acetylmuramoyl-L-alanine amidase
MNNKQSEIQQPASGTDPVVDPLKKETDNTLPEPSEPVIGKFRIFSALQVVISAAFITATLFTLWTPDNLFSSNLLSAMLRAAQSQPDNSQRGLTISTASPNTTVGIVAGHWGRDNDPGAVCDDGETEVNVNVRIATMVQQNLIAEGFQVDLLQEFDKRLAQYKGRLLVSIHNDSCKFISNDATGFKVASSRYDNHPERSSRLTACMIDRYRQTTGLRFHFNTITDDMTKYHTFQEIDPETTAAIIETGFLNLDREILTKKTSLVAKGVTAGILCYLNNEPVSALQASPTP